MKDTAKAQLRAAVDELRELRDEIKVKLHLAGMDAKDTWKNKLEPEWHEVEKKVERAGDAAAAEARKAAEALRRSYQSFRDQIKKISA